MNINTFLDKLKSEPKSVTFAETIALIEENYHFTPTAFKNGNQYNEVEQNNGSCKVFAFAKLNNLSKQETLLLFCEHYQAVINTPDSTDHQNIRNFIQFGWNGITFEGTPLQLKTT